MQFNTFPPAGTKDFLPDDVVIRDWFFDSLKKTFRLFGFSPIDTPALERVDTLMGKYGLEGEKLIFQILKRGNNPESETDLALRYDLTIPLARFMARYQSQLPAVFRRYQIGSVWRADRPGKGRYREFSQVDLDIIGSSSLLADAEVIFVLVRALENLGLGRFSISLNSRKILFALLEIYNIDNQVQKKGVLTALDKFNKIGSSGVVEELELLGLPSATIRLISKELKMPFNDMKDRISKTKSGREGIEEIENIKIALKSVIDSERINLTPFLARGLEYYTGPIFEMFSSDSKLAIVSGGRYDNLLQTFSGRKMPACGGSIGVDRVLDILKQAKAVPAFISKPVFITVWDQSFYGETLKIASLLSSHNILVTLYLGKGNLSDQLRTALEQGIRYCIIYGPNERKAGKIIIRDFQTEKQSVIDESRFLTEIRKFFHSRRQPT